MIENDSRPSPSPPATAALPSDVAAIQHGGCGSCTGLGVTMRREVEVLAVELEVLRLPHADDGLDGLLPLLAAGVAVDAERGLLHRRRPAGAPLDAAVGQDVGGGHLLGHAHRRRERVRHERHAEAEPEVLGALRQRADEHLGRRAVRAALAEVVLDVPRRVEAQRVGELDLLDRLRVGALLGLALAVRVGLAPRLRHVDLVQQVEFQGAPDN